MIIGIGILAFWLTCGAIDRALVIGYFSHKYPWFSCYRLANFGFLAGPCGLVVSLTQGPPYRFRWKHPTMQEGWEAFHKDLPLLSYEQFERTWR